MFCAKCVESVLALNLERASADVRCRVPTSGSPWHLPLTLLPPLVLTFQERHRPAPVSHGFPSLTCFWPSLDRGEEAGREEIRTISSSQRATPDGGHRLDRPARLVWLALPACKSQLWSLPEPWAPRLPPAPAPPPFSQRLQLSHRFAGEMGSFPSPMPE